MLNQTKIITKISPFAFSAITDVITALKGASTRLGGSLKVSIASRRVGPVYH